MPRDTLTGSRIRERRGMMGIKQADLARQAGISPSYLNLIEHNRRRIGGKLLLRLAEILRVEPVMLSEGAEATLVAGLRDAAARGQDAAAELDRVDEFAGRFPGWAGLLVEGRHRIDALERSVETLSDRLTHDPHLAAALHDMLSTVTAIRATAAILAEPGEISPDWQRRFHRNVAEDSARLAETSRTLVSYLDRAGDAGAEASAPQEEVDAILQRLDHRVAALEGESAADDPSALEALAADLAGAASPAARKLLARHLRRYAEDARALPESTLAAALAETGPDPFRLAARLGADPGRVMRRLAVLPETLLDPAAGLALCDASGALLWRRPVPDFPLPRFGAGCPLWPLYAALNRPMMALCEEVALPGSPGARFTAYAIATPRGLPEANRPPLFEAQMLLVPQPAEAGGAAPKPIGTDCRICPRRACPGRREPSILSAGRGNGGAGPELDF
ncbi:helix-turn-helix domain-containing protein [Roseivivax sp. CAU 1761]